MMTFIKAQASSILGSLADFLTTIVLVQLLHSYYLIGNLAGNIVGAIIQFTLSRSWAFNAGEGKLSGHILKYILVWIGNLILSAAGVYFFTHYLKINYIISKTIVSIFLGVTYNYFFQKRFVFT
jgi:putative flippase GtrA